MASPAKSIKVALIGLGRMGSGYDGGKIVGVPRSHVGAILANPALELLAACDSAPDARTAFTADWGLPVPVFETPEQLFAYAHYDIVVVATLTATHEQVLEACLVAGPSIIFCEKPFCDSVTSAARLASQFADKGIQVAVNYHRRWDERFSLLSKAIQQSGPVRHVDLLYMKGLRNYGAHAIDLLQFLFGPVRRVWPLPRPVAEVEDPSYSAILGFTDGLQVNMMGFDNIDYELLDLDIITQSARFNVDIGGHAIGVRYFEEGLHFKGYKNLSAMQALVESRPVHGLTKAYEEFVRSLSSVTPVVTSLLDNAVGVQRVMDAMVEATHSGERVSL